MGIPTCRFMDQTHEQFVCAICLDVADDAVLLNGCEHIFCRECIQSDGLKKCPSCQEPINPVETKPINGALKRCYIGMKIKCLNPVCDHVMDATNYKDHDDSCLVTFTHCDDCGYKTRRGQDSSHSCVRELKDDYDKKLILLKNELKQKNRFETQYDKLALIVLSVVIIPVMLLLVAAVNSNTNTIEQLKAELIDVKEQLVNERYRYENLIASSVSFKNGFDDNWVLTKEKIEDIIGRFQSVKSVKTLEFITSTIDDIMAFTKNYEEQV